MKTGKIQLERGDLGGVWAGGGYHAPAPGGSGEPPPGWNAEPPQYLPPTPENQMPEDEEVRLNAQPPVPAPADDVMEAVRAEIARLEIPDEIVNIDKGTARFRGHTLVLSDVARDEIARILADEVIFKLHDEQRRVLESVGGKAKMGSKEPSGPLEVLGMREPKAPARKKNVRRVPRQKDSQA